MKTCLVSIDGWGLAPSQSKGNAIANADTPVMDELSAGVVIPAENPNANPGQEEQDHKHLIEEKASAAAGHAKADTGGVCVAIDASGRAVGLPPKIMGNSEVGHLGMGAGQVNFQDLVRINDNLAAASANKQSWASENSVLEGVLRAVRQKTAAGLGGSGRLHLMGLVSDGGVHSHIDHLLALVAAAKASPDVGQLFIHFFADGRDTPPRSSPAYVNRVLKYCADETFGTLATIQGRYYAMDRDKRWERTKLAYEALVAGLGEPVASVGDGSGPVAAVEARHAAGQTDEFLTPIIIDKDAVVKDEDTVLLIDFRADRMRQIAQCFALPDEDLPFELSAGVKRPARLQVATMTQYRSDFAHLPTLFPPQTMTNTLAEWLAVQKRRQLHVAETEKYAHVTFFFNGGVEKKFEGEDRKLIASPKVATYDLDPKMSVNEVADAVCAGVESGDYDFVMCNMAPPDMVGHTGNYEATITACNVTDKAIGRVRQACRKAGFALVVTADHGNAERMYDAAGKPYTAHTTNLVPLCVDNVPGVKLAADVVHGAQATESSVPQRVPSLADVAPTVLSLMGLPLPPEMTGKSIVDTASISPSSPKLKRQKTAKN